MKTFLLIFICLQAFSFASFASDEHLKEQTSDFNAWKNRPHEKFSHGEEAFNKVKDILLQKYQDSGVTEDDLYRAATEGMLANLSGKTPSWDKLLSPLELSEMQSDMDGEIVGIGIEMKFDSDSGITEVLSVIPGTPSEKDGLKVGDKILKINGKFFKGEQMRDVVYAIRGRAGDSVTLSILRGDKVITKKVTREKVAWSPVKEQFLSHDVGVIDIGYFSNGTPELVKDALEKMAARHVKGLILDLRNNQGGVFEGLVQTAQMLLPAGKTIVTKVKRGGVEEAIVSKGPTVFAQAVPIEVLVNSNTASSAEMLAGALKENLGSRVIGEKTKGKWSAQSVEELPNKFAIKYTVSFFKTPQGESLDGKGLEPDVVVNMDWDKVDGANRMTDEKERLSADVQLRTAFNLLTSI